MKIIIKYHHLFLLYFFSQRKSVLIKCILLYVFLNINLTQGFGQSYSEGADLPNSLAAAGGTIFNLNAAQTYNYSGTLNTPNDRQDDFVVNIANGFQVTSVSYSFTAGSVQPYQGVVAFTYNNADAGLSGASSGSLNIGGAVPPGQYYVLTAADFAVGVNWTVTIVVEGIPNQPPTTSGGIPDESVLENAASSVINLDTYFNDDAGDDNLTYSLITTDPVFFSTSVNNTSNELTIDYVNLGTGGPVNVTVRATDSEGESVDQTFGVTVNGSSVTFSMTGTETVTEGNSGNTTVTYTITKVGTTNVDSQVDFNFTGGDATPNLDYTNFGGTGGASASSGTITFSAGTTTHTITTDVQGDVEVEGNETIILIILNASASGSGTAIVTNVMAANTITKTILNDDSSPSYSIGTSATATIKNDEASGVTITESGSTDVTEGGATDSYTVVLVGTPSSNVTITFTPNNNNIDLGSGAGNAHVVTFMPGNAGTPQTITVTANDDALVEGPHSSVISINTSSGESGFNDLMVNDITVNVTDNDSPNVVSIVRAGTNPTNLGSVNFTVTFDAAVSGVGQADFTTTVSGITGTSVTGVGGSGTTYTVSVNTGAGDGTIRLDVVDDNSITSLSGSVPLGGVVAGDGNFTSGEVYDIDKTAPNAPDNLDLAAASDSGIDDTDNWTMEQKPMISGTAEANSTVKVSSNIDGLLATIIANGSGNWNFTVTSNLTEGIHLITATATDASANESVASNALPIQIDITPPSGMSTIDMLAATDSGTSNSDNITNDQTPDFEGDSEALAIITLSSNQDGVLGTANADINGDWSFTPSSNLSENDHTISAASSDGAGNQELTPTTLNATIDVTAPSSPTFSPVDNATEVAINSNLVLTFSENIVKQSGNVLLKKSSDNSTVESIAVSSGLVTISNAVVTINPTNDLEQAIGYYVQIDNGALEDLAGNDYAGISDNSTWNFNTFTPVVTIAATPSTITEDGATNLVFTFTRTGSNAAPLTINFTIGGTADPTSDYTQSGANTFNTGTLTGTVIIPIGSLTKDVVITSSNDALVEGSETVILTLAAP